MRLESLEGLDRGNGRSQLNLLDVVTGEELSTVLCATIIPEVHFKLSLFYPQPR